MRPTSKVTHKTKQNITNDNYLTNFSKYLTFLVRREPRSFFLIIKEIRHSFSLFSYPSCVDEFQSDCVSIYPLWYFSHTIQNYVCTKPWQMEGQIYILSHVWMQEKNLLNGLPIMVHNGPSHLNLQQENNVKNNKFVNSLPIRTFFSIFFQQTLMPFHLLN